MHDRSWIFNVLDNVNFILCTCIYTIFVTALMCWKIVNKFIAKNITSVESQTRISCIPYERPKPLDYRGKFFSQ